jgi:hypothetical protein
MGGENGAFLNLDRCTSSNGHLFAVVGFIQNRIARWAVQFQCKTKILIREVLQMAEKH